MGLHPFGGRLGPNDTYLSYFDTCLKQSDVDTLKDDWLTDTVIEFWEDYLEKEKLSDFPQCKIVLLRPSISHLLLRTRRDAVMDLGTALPDLRNTTHMFLTVNDSREFEVAEGGSHWSLLVVSLIDGVSFHYDSLSPTNVNDARLLTDQLSLVTGTKLQMLHLDGTPQQDNGSDCGVFVCLMMQHLLFGKLLSKNTDKPINMSLRNVVLDATAGRKEMLKIIDSRRKDAQRLQSRSKSPGRGKSRSPPRISETSEKAV